MRTAQLVLTLAALAMSVTAQPPAPTKAANAPAATDQAAQDKLHASAMKFVVAFDVRQRLQQGLDKLLEEGKQSMLRTSPGLAPQFADEWVKRMKLRVSLDEFVAATAHVYEKYFTSDELDELAQTQLAMKIGQVYTLPPPLAEKLKTDSPFIQRDINVATSVIGARLGKEVGQEIEKEHPEWVKAPPPAPTAKKS